MESNHINLYDLPLKTNTCWSPHVWKARLALGYKGVPFSTVWTAYPDIKPTFPHLSTPSKPLVTLPIIKTSSGELYTDSWDIAEYLENTYPNKNSLFHGNANVHFFFQQYIGDILFGSLRFLVVPRMPAHLDERSAEYFNRTRQVSFGVPLSELLARDPTPYLNDLKKGLKPINTTLTRTKHFLNGDEPSYSDIILLSVFLWIQVADEALLQTILGFYESEILKQWFERCVALFNISELKTH